MFIIPHYDPTNLPYLISFLRSLNIIYKKGRKNDDFIYVFQRSKFYDMYKNYCQHFNYPTFDEKIFNEYLIQKESGITYVKSNGVRCYRFEKVNFEKALTHFSPYFFTETEE